MNFTAKLMLVSLCVSVISACDRNSNNDSVAAVPVAPAPPPPPVMQEFELEVVNLTNAQILSPIALVSHESSYQLFSIGDTASIGLEILAEGGDNTELLLEASADDAVLQAISGSGPVMPGATDLISITIAESALPGMRLSFATMLINTNDAITAAHGLNIENLEIGEAFTVSTLSYDSGTEANTEELGTIPGPADSGEGFNAERDDVIDIIRGHGGVVTQDDGLMTSILNQNHRWDNPVARVTIRRVL